MPYGYQLNDHFLWWAVLLHKLLYKATEQYCRECEQSNYWVLDSEYCKNNRATVFGQ